MAKNQYEGLTEQQLKFADYYLELNNGTLSAKKAGYSEKGAHVQASVLLKNPKIQAYLDDVRRERREAITNTLAKHTEEAVQILIALARNSESDSVRLQAVKDIMDRAGYKPTEKVESKNELSGGVTFSFVDPNEED